MVATLFLSLWLVVLLMPPLATTADSILPTRQQFHLRMHHTIILVIPCIATMHVLLLYIHAVYSHTTSPPSQCDLDSDMSVPSACMHGSMHSGIVPKAELLAMHASFVMLFTLATYRALWLLQWSPVSPSDLNTQSLLKQLQQEETLIALSKRFLIRKSFQFVLVAVVAQSLLCPSIVGAFFLVGSASCMLAFGVATGAQPVTASVFAAVASAVWGVLQYAVCSEWLQGCLHVDDKGSSMDGVLRVLGVPALQVCAQNSRIPLNTETAR